MNNFCSNISHKRFLYTAVYGNGFVLLLLALLFVCPPFHDDSSFAITGTSIASDTTLSINIANPTLSLELTPTSSSGTFATSSPANIYVATNNITGYTLGIKTNSNNDTSSLLINNTEKCENTPTSVRCSLSSLDTSISETDYSAAASTNLNNTWGYSPSRYNSQPNTDYLPAPSITGDIINVTSSPNTTNTGNTENTTDELIPDEYTINLGARIDYTPYAGSFSNTFIITAVGNMVPYSVSYDSNIPTPVLSTAEVYDMPTAQTGKVSSGNTVAVVLKSNTPILKDSQTNEYVGYGFAGWCTAPTEIIDDGTDKNYQKCPDSATLYRPGDNFGVDQTAENTQILYAVWGYATIITFESNAPSPEITGTMATQLIAAGQTMPLIPNSYSRIDCVFDSWNTAADYSGITYSDQANFTASATSPEQITLYAQWKIVNLYKKIQSMVKRDSNNHELTQTPSDMQATITEPTSNNPLTDTSNSGIYKYDSAIYGVADDANNNYDIYYYRGILDSSFSSSNPAYGGIGSSGDGYYYPNYIRLGNNTCWRIYRTTGSGGIKMLYNGTWDSNNNTCANTDNKAIVNKISFNSMSNNAVYVGYTYNSAMIGNIDSTSANTVFGSNTNLAANDTLSNIKDYLENTWYTNIMANNTTRDYTDLLEPSAGYCNDRSAYDRSNIQITDIIPEGSERIYFGPTNRVGGNSTDKIPTLTCPRGDIDNYHYVTNSSIGYTANILKYPVALITADEVYLTGGGYTSILPLSARAFLNAGTPIWLLSPYYHMNGEASGFILDGSSSFDAINMYQNAGLRPVISLKHETTIISGTGTAANPWLISEN